MVDLDASNLSSVFDDENEKEEIVVETKAKGSKRGASNLVQGLEINFQDSDLDQEEELEEEPRKKKAKVGNNNKKSDLKTKKKSQGGKIDGATLEQHRRYMGDQVKSKLRVLGGKGNYGIAASCHASMSCSVALFRTLVVPNAAKVTPADFDSSSPVVLAQIDSTEQIGKIFGVSKIRDGTRLGSWSASKMDLVFLPKEASGQLRAWWTMHDY